MQKINQIHLFKLFPIKLKYCLSAVIFTLASVYTFEHFISYPTLIMTYATADAISPIKEEKVIFRKQLTSSVLWDWVVPD